MMKSTFTLLFFYCFTYSSFGQTAASITGVYSRNHGDISKVNLNGQWRGSFNELTPNIFGFVDNQRTTYVLELNIRGSQVSGYSYTYFIIGGKKYYTICRITGSLDKKLNNLVVTEVERIKHNTPPEIRNCFQVHRLHYVKGDDQTEYLRGDWSTAPGQTTDCGKGETELSRKVVSRAPFAIKLPPKKEQQVAKQTPRHSSPVPPPHVVKEEPKPGTGIISGIPEEKEKSIRLETDHKLKKAPLPLYKGYENRKNNIVKTINISQPVFQVDLYDNGEIDGDSISLFFNGKLILANKMLTDKPITLTLSIDKDFDENTITMYAENLGRIPPNTALMIVRDGDKRYEVRMESDLGKSGTVVFTHQSD